MLALLWTTGCMGSGDQPVLTAPTRYVRQALVAARTCGIAVARVDPLDDARAMLLIGRNTSQNRIDCLFRWLFSHRVEGMQVEMTGGPL